MNSTTNWAASRSKNFTCDSLNRYTRNNTPPDGRREVAAKVPRPTSGLGEELVFIDHGRHRHFGVGSPIIYTHHFAFAAYPDALRESDFRRKREGELDGGAARDRRIHEKANATGAYVSRLSGYFLVPILRVGDRDWEAQPKLPGRPLFLLRFGHETSRGRCKHRLTRADCQDMSRTKALKMGCSDPGSYVRNHTLL